MSVSFNAVIEQAKKQALEELREPTREMLKAARDWSSGKYGKPIGDDDARGCWQAMLRAALANNQRPECEA